MEVIKQMFRDLRRMGKKQLVVAGAFTVAVAAAVSLGLASNMSTRAAGVRDTGHNPIMNVGPIGCLTKEECISDMRANKPSDLQLIYAYFGLSADEYDRFLRTAVPATFYKNGEVIAGGQKVIYGAISTGRDKFNAQREAYSIPGAGTYYKSPVSASFAANSIDGWVMFDANGDVEFALLSACGNPVWGTKVTPKFSCDKLTKTAVQGKKDTYSFKTDATAINNASIVRYEYDFGDGTKQSSTSNTIEHTFAKPGNYDVTVKVIVKLPGGQEKEVTAINCKTKVTVLAPYYACTTLVATARDEKKQEFRVATRIKYGNGATPKSVDFTADGVTVTGVTAKDSDGNYYKDYTFTDDKEHVITAKVHFDVDGKDVVSTEKCEAKVTSKKTPMCTVKGKENYPPNAPECFEECKPGIPVGDARCNPVKVEECKPGVPVGSADCEEKEMPNTGAGNVLGLFAGTSALGAIGHRLFKSRFGRS
jgi:PKD repeat protein